MKKQEILKNELDVFDFLSGDVSIYVGLNFAFVDGVKKRILDQYGTLKRFNREFLKIEYPNLKHDFQEARYHSITRWLKILKAFNIDREELFKNITCFRVNGSHSINAIILPRTIALDSQFMEGYSLYIAEGDTGLSGRTVPKKLRFTNANLDVIKFFINWIKTFVPGNSFYVNTILPSGIPVEKDFSRKVSEKLDIEVSKIKVKSDFYNKIIKYRVCLDSIIIINLVLALDDIVKMICRRNNALAVGYIKGIMAGEGTVYFNKSRYVRIEMRNEREIRYVHSLLKNLKYNCEVSLRSERKGMCSIYIGAKQLEKFYNEIGFGSELNRQNILRLAVEKKLRVNQYI